MKRTAGLLLLAVCPWVARAQTADEKKATIAFVRGLQTTEGGFLPAPPTAGRESKEQPSLRATSAALRALKYFGGEPKDREASVRFVQACFDKESGGFRDRLQPDSKPDVATTAVGIMAVVELKMPAADYEVPVSKYLNDHAKAFEEVRIAAAAFEALGKRSPRSAAWLEQLAKLRNGDGTFGKGAGAARDTGGAAAAILRLGGSLDQRDAVLHAIQSGQRADGAFGKADAPGSDLETTYRVVRALVMFKEKPKDVEGLRQFMPRCRNADGGYGVSPGRPSQVGPTYFASIVLHWLQEK